MFFLCNIFYICIKALPHSLHTFLGNIIFIIVLFSCLLVVYCLICPRTLPLRLHIVVHLPSDYSPFGLLLNFCVIFFCQIVLLFMPFISQSSFVRYELFYAFSFFTVSFIIFVKFSQILYCLLHQCSVNNQPFCSFAS